MDMANGRPPPEDAPAEGDAVRAAFEEKGYYVFRHLIPGRMIDALLDNYREKVLPSRKPFFRQSTNTWERNVLNPHGYSRESFLDIHDLRDSEFHATSALARNILCSREIRAALSSVTGQPEHSLMQSMLFDLNVGTQAHQDCFYLDSVPNGQLLAGWFALEDIPEDAGRFFVYPGSNRMTIDLTPAEEVSNDLYLKKVDAFMKPHWQEISAPALQKGDVLFWHSRTIHGSLKTRDERYSRRSLTAHYMPSTCEFGNSRGRVTPVLYRLHDGMPYRYIDRRYSPMSQAAVVGYKLLNRYPGVYRYVERAVRRYHALRS
jgi:phytanoyl-CoA hydroxylase